MKNNKKGFTLAELLIVVAIIGVLAAIAIPIYSNQMTSAKTAVDKANASAIESMAVAEAMLKGTGGTYYGEKADGGMTVTTTKPTTGYNEAEQGGQAAGGAVYAVEVSATYGITSAAWGAKGP